jgi:putative membrane protein
MVFLTLYFVKNTNEYGDSVSKFFSQSTVLITGSFLFFFVLFELAYVLYTKAYINRYYYDFEEKFITIKKGVFSPTEIHVQYQKIQDVYVDQEIINRLFGLYDVHISSATTMSGMEAHINGVDFETSEVLKNLILSKINDTSGNVLGGQNFDSAGIGQKTVNQNQVVLPSEISSNTFPVSGAWLVSAIWSSILRGLYILLFIFIAKAEVAPAGSGLVLNLYIFGLVFFSSLLWSALWKKYYYFEFTNEFILYRTGIISRQENHLPYTSIQNIINKQGIVDRILGISTVVIQNASQNIVVENKNRTVVNGGVNLIWQPKQAANELTRILNEITGKINFNKNGL